MFTMDSSYGRSVSFYPTDLPVLRESCFQYDNIRELVVISLSERDKQISQSAGHYVNIQVSTGRKTQ